MSSKSKKKFPTAILVIGGLLLALGIYAALSPEEKSVAQESSPGKLTLSETSWNLGTVSMKDGMNEKIVELKNETDSPVTVTEMQTSCMCTNATIINEDGKKGPTKGMVGHGGGTPRMSQVIAPGETAKLSIVYDPNAHGPNAVGPISRNVTLKTDSTNQSTIDLKFTGIVTK